jgi:hypothetical protein
MIVTVWLKRLLTIGAGLESGAGLGLLVAPSALALGLLGSPLDGSGLVVARLAGAGLLALGIACWKARVTPTAPAALGVSWAFLVYNAVVCIVLAGTNPPLAGRGLLVVGASALHGLLGIGLGSALMARRANQPAPR